ncbi:TniQ family protein [Streptomyces sp. TRM66268-LWL]|uniref:TniQ family protein n=1 Tax=Streptomyces polyasparticus TaxID=2767826 RepID=A0ABR7SX68_9ACTN|nr:TniQ family protein [Streptomyces polyasparticus]MBC9718853.1 TniQ family protein [Streptomyces polyasparticus]
MPRSITPVAGETLASVLMRLSYRLRTTPLVLADRAGLRSSPTAPAARLATYQGVRLDEKAAQALAHVLRLDPEAVHRLTLAGQAPGYPQLHSPYLGFPRDHHIQLVHDEWIFTRFSRYCPQCLAEAADTEAPSPWQGLWKLPITFICPTHQRYLRWRCPTCDSPALSTGFKTTGAWRPPQLIPSPRTRLHPAQCRSRPADLTNPRGNAPWACGARLDHAFPGPAADPRLLAVQERFHHLATTPGVTTVSIGQTATASQYFTDLRTVVTLITSTWPTATYLPVPDGPAALMAPLEHAMATAPTHHTTGQVKLGDLTSPLTDPQAGAALLTVAHQILTAPDAAGRLRTLLDARVPIRHAREGLLRLLDHGSPALRAASDSHRAELTRRRYRTPAFTPPTHHRGQLDARRIPQCLPDAHLAHLAHLETRPAPPAAVRRAAAIHLVQMALPIGHREARAYLGLRPSSARFSMTLSWLQSGDNAMRYRTALSEIAEKIMADPAPIDYHHRRAALHHWHIPPEDWDALIQQISRRQNPASLRSTTWTPARHTGASATVWAHITHGETRYAPQLAQGERTHHDRAVIEAINLKRPRERLHALLREHLRDYATALATRIDRNTPHGPH